MGSRLVPIAAIALLVACAAPSAVGAPSIRPGASRPPGSASEPAPSGGFRREATSDDAGLTLTATFDRLEVEAGGTVAIHLAIENRRASDVVFEEPCQPGSMTVGLAVPTEPIGRNWTGLAAAFKTYALETSSGSPMESSVRTRQETPSVPERCHAQAGEGRNAAGEAVRIIPAGATYETGLMWTAEIVKGVPAVPGDAPYAIKVLHDLAPAGGGLIRAETLEISGMLTVLAGQPSAVSAGGALDATIADKAFRTWLAKQPRSSWVNANLFLQPGAIGAEEGVLPVVPYWSVELFREPRNWAIYSIEAMTGEVLVRNICNMPCDR